MSGTLPFRHVVVNPTETKNDDIKLQKNKKLCKIYHPAILKIFKYDLGFQILTPIQQASISTLSAHAAADEASPLSGDVILSVATGQGKTLCYVMPIMSDLFYDPVTKIRAIIFAPTRELISQIVAVFNSFCNSSLAPASVNVLQLSASAPFLTESKQLRASGLKGPQIIVTSPGRFLEHCQIRSRSTTAKVLERSGYNNKIFSVGGCDEDMQSLWWNLHHIVFDEVDRILEEEFSGWLPALDKIIDKCYIRPRKILATATMTDNPEKLELLKLRKPLFFISSKSTNSYAVPPELRQSWILCPSLSRTVKQSKPLTLVYLLHQLSSIPVPKKKSRKVRKLSQSADASSMSLETEEEPVLAHKIVIFCNSKSRAAAVTNLINIHFGKSTWKSQPPALVSCIKTDPSRRGFEIADEIPGFPVQIEAQLFSASLSQKDRHRILASFQQSHNTSKFNVLVCSDIVARGIDVDSVDVVISYDPPVTLQSYVHRAGRTARAGRCGASFCLVNQDELNSFARLLKSNVLADGDEGGESLTLWDVCLQLQINKSHLRPWVQKAEFASSLSDDAENIQKLETSYFDSLFVQLDKTLPNSKFNLL